MSRQIGVLLLFMLSGCSTLSYYGQAVHGQASLLLNRQSVPGLLKSSKTPSELRARLETSQAVLRFAEERLHLSAHGRYRSLVITGRRAVVWNVVTTPALSLAPLHWCYPIVGCLPYRGFFSEARARREATQLRAAGKVVSVGGVPAYSTLGWFKDPLLDTFIHWPDADLANLLFHELAHGRVWVNGDAQFNESLASFVGNAGVTQWLIDRPADLDRYLRAQTLDERFERRLAGLRKRLESVYASRAADQEKQRLADAVYAEFRRCHMAARRDSQTSRFDAIVATGLNNAYLAGRQTYAQYEPAFAILYRDAGHQWPQFWSAVEQLIAMSKAARHQHLGDLSPDPTGASDQHQGTDCGNY